MQIRRGLINKGLLFLVISLVSLTSAFSLSLADTGASIISPASGTWSNYQSLILSVPSGCDVFYSLTGTDPLVSGFAYDGPVLLEMSGDVTVSIVTVYPDDVRIYSSTSYSVNLDSVHTEKLYTQLGLSAVSPYTVIEHDVSIAIPEAMYYSLSDGVEPYISGRTISVNKRNAYSQYQPLIVDDGFSRYRFMVYINGIAEMQEPVVPIAPITCTDWDYVSFTSDYTIRYSVDDSEWKEAKNSFYLDRSKSHKISWQYVPKETIISTDFQPPLEEVEIDTSMQAKIRKYVLQNETEQALIENVESEEPIVETVVPSEPVYYEINSIVLPAKPAFLGVPENGITNKAVTLQLSDSAYLFYCQSEGVSHEFSKAFTVDCLQGASIDADFQFKVYYSGIYQGTLSASFVIDKTPPQSPDFNASTTNRYSRNSVLLRLAAEGTVYYSIENAIESAEGFTDESIQTYVLNKISKTNIKFIPLEGRSILLPEKPKKAVLYTVHAYCRDAAGNNSDESLYNVVVDPANFYLDFSLPDSSDADGSPSRPFNSTNALLESALDNTVFTRIFISGECYFPSSILLQNDCDILGSNNARIVFSDDAGLLISDADVSISGCIIETHSSTLSDIKSPSSLFVKNLITVVDSSISVNDCEIVAVYGSSGSIFSLSNSTLSIKDSGFTLQANSYASIFSAQKSDIDAESVRCSTVSETALVFSVNGGSLSVRNSSLKVTATLGRIAELSGVSYSFVKNNFASTNLTSKNRYTTPAIWTDSSSILIENKQNSETGFSASRE